MSSVEGKGHVIQFIWSWRERNLVGAVHILILPCVVPSHVGLATSQDLFVDEFFCVFHDFFFQGSLLLSRRCRWNWNSSIDALSITEAGGLIHI